jgi:hypothetical protein
MAFMFSAFHASAAGFAATSLFLAAAIHHTADGCHHHGQSS